MIKRLGRLLKGSGFEAALARGATAAIVVNVGAAAVALALQILLARVLGVDSFGRYVYVMTVSNFLVLLMPLGLGHTTLRYVPAYSGKMEWGLLRGFLRRSGQIVFVVTAIAGPLAAAERGRIETGWVRSWRIRSSFCSFSSPS